MKKGISILFSIIMLAACATPKIPKEQVGQAKSEEVEGSYVVVDVTLTDGKVTKIGIDETGASSFDGEKTGTKKQLGDEYGMKTFSKIDKEWFQQIKALEEYIVAKGIDSIKVEDQHVTNDDLKTSVTIKVDKYLEVSKKAIEDAKTKK